VLEAPVRPPTPESDPLSALRAADGRPLHEQWRERFHDWLKSRPANLQRGVAIAVVGVLVIVVGQRLVRASEPPIEDSLPMAQEAATTLPPSATTSAGASEVAQVDVADQELAIVLHVAGAVAEPGLVVGLDGWRVADAIAAAGGSTPGADLNRVNLAARVADGERLYIPAVDEEPPAVVAGSGGGGAASASGLGPINLNAATPGDLEQLPGVGPVTAAAIVAHRDAHGAFGSVDSLVAVRGIGPATLETLRDHATVG
jgi:competence protein ComEA